MLRSICDWWWKGIMNERGRPQRKKLDHLHILIHIPEMSGLHQTLANLSVVDDHFDIDHLDITVEIGGQGTPLSPEDQKLLDDRLAESRRIRENTEGISTVPPVPGA